MSFTVLTGHLTGCGNTKPHVLLTFASAKSEHFSSIIKTRKIRPLLVIKQLPYNPKSKNFEVISYFEVFLPKQFVCDKFLISRHSMNAATHSAKEMG